MEKYKVGIIGGTGMVGQRFITLMENHPWFQLTCIAASPRSAGQRYEDAVAKMEAAEIRDTRPQLNLIAEDGETAIKLAVKDECGLRFDDF